MKLSKKFTTVTPLSKFIALILFVVFPFVGFYFGLKYQKLLDENNLNTSLPSSIACMQDVKLCPDGTQLTRKGPNCEFDPCPLPNTSGSSLDRPYSNLTYGYSLIIPKGFYDPSSNTVQSPEQIWVNKGASLQESGYTGGAWILVSVEVGQDGVSLSKDYLPLINTLAVGATTTTPYKQIITKLASITTSNVTGMTYEARPPDNFQGESAYSYGAVWIRENKVYRLELGTVNKTSVQTYKPQFDRLVSTFSFK